MTRNFLSNPFKRFEDMQFMYHSKTLGMIEIDPIIWKRLSKREIAHIIDVCDQKLDDYYHRLTEKVAKE